MKTKEVNFKHNNTFYRISVSDTIIFDGVYDYIKRKGYKKNYKSTISFSISKFIWDDVLEKMGDQYHGKTDFMRKIMEYAQNYLKKLEKCILFKHRSDFISFFIRLYYIEKFIKNSFEYSINVVRRLE